MEIKTITCHRVFNYGASLQAYALQHYLEFQGHKVEIIDYLPDYNQRLYNIWFIDNKTKVGQFFNKHPYLKFPLIPLKNRQMFLTWKRRQAFLTFEKVYLHVTDERYETIDDLRHNPPIADVYIVGSDQVWNTDMQNGCRPPFYLDFGHKNTLRISYAASFGIPLIREEYKSFVKHNLQAFSHISVREAGGLRILESIGINNGVHVLDPVFLLDAQEWGVLERNAKSYNLQDNGYILVYDFEHTNPKIKPFVKKMAKQRGLPIVSINDSKLLSYANRNISNAGPLEFLNLIKHASAVVCNSFHGTAISIIFQKEFYVFPLQGQRNSERMTNLLEMFGLLERFEPSAISPINYSFVNLILKSKIKESVAYLHNALNSKP